MQNTQRTVAIIGGGPAGLMAAEAAAASGARVMLFDAKPSVGRKFLIAGKSGLNITNSADFEKFVSVYSGATLPEGKWNELLSDFDNDALREWCLGLGIETFAASTRKVFPTTMKAAPLLRRWVERLKSSGVSFHMRHELSKLSKGSNEIELRFTNEDQQVIVSTDSVVLALGGGSLPKTGSTGAWVKTLAEHHIDITPLTAANSGWEIGWPAQVLDDAEGKPLKNITVTCQAESRQGELVITRYGLEGGPIYRLGTWLREQLHAGETPTVSIDLKPPFTVDRLCAKMESAKRNLVKEAGQRWKLNEAGKALLQWKASQLTEKQLTTEALANIVKSLDIPFNGPRPIDEAISSAGGVHWDELTANLELKKLPGVFLAGEMIDWEAPTGGFLMQGCFATGLRAGRAAGSPAD